MMERFEFVYLFLFFQNCIIINNCTIDGIYLISHD